MCAIEIVTTTTAFACFNTKKNTGSSLLTLIICGRTLHSWLFIEIKLDEFTLVKVDKNVNPVKKALFNKPKHFIVLPDSSSLNNCERLIYHQQQYRYNQH